MATDEQRLIVSLEANIRRFQTSLDKATGVADDRMLKIQKRFDRGSDQITRGMARIGSQSIKFGQSLDANKTTQRLIDGMSAAGKAAGGAVSEFEGVAEASSHVSTQAQAAFHSMRAMAEGFALGMPPSQVLTQQLNHLSYAASGPGGLKAAFGGAIGLFTKMLNPVTVLAGGLATLGVAATAAAVSYANAQSRIALALTGVGSAGGVTVDTINKIADATASAGQISVSEARDFATAIAATGKSSAAVTGQATALAKSFSLVFDEDLDKSAKDLGAALADPAKGVDTLNAKLLAFDATTVNFIKRLAAQGNLEEAQKTILAGIATATATAAAKTTGWARAYDELANSISNYITAAGKAVLPSSFQSPEDQLAAAEARLKQLQNGRTLRGSTIHDNGAIAETKKEIADLKDQIDQAGQAGIEAGRNLESLKFNDLINEADPATASLRALEDQLTALNNNKTIPLGDQRAQLARANDQVKTSIAYLKQLQALGNGNIDVGAAVKQSQIDIDAINARTAAEKAAVAYEQTYQQAIMARKGAVVATAEATAAANKSMAQSEHDLAEARRDRIFQANQSVAQAKLETSLIGGSIDVVTTMTQRFQMLAAAKAEAFKNGNVDSKGNPIISPEELAAIDQAAIKLGILAREQATIRTQGDAMFDIEQLGRDRQEQNVFGTLQSAGLLDNGQIVSAQAKQTAEILRTREALGELADTERTFASSFLQDLIQGKSAAAALGDALNAVASKLLDMGIDKLVAGTLGGGGAPGIASLLGFADGGVFVPGKGPQKLKTFAGGGISNQAAIFGEAGPEAAIPLKGGKVPVDLRMPKVAATPAQSAPISIVINAPNSTKESVDALNANTIPKIKEIVRSEILQTANRSAAFKKAVGRA